MNIDKPFEIKAQSDILKVSKVGTFEGGQSVFVIGLESASFDKSVIVSGEEIKKLVGYLNAHLILDKHGN